MSCIRMPAREGCGAWCIVEFVGFCEPAWALVLVPFTVIAEGLVMGSLVAVGEMTPGDLLIR